jgi:hypothetical protein
MASGDLLAGKEEEGVLPLYATTLLDRGDSTMAGF